MKKFFLFLFSLICICFIVSGKLFSQVIVGFEASSYEACAPFNISFTNTTTGCAGNATYTWDPGNGDAVSHNINPTFLYSSAGTFTVTLSVECQGTVYTSSQQIIIHNGPTANFNSEPQLGCIPMSASFNDQSLVGDAPITSWTWYFGDGNSSFQQNSSHIYHSAGKYSVSLSVSDQNSCSSVFVVDSAIYASSSPIVNFFATQTDYCTAPFTTSFNSNITTYQDADYTINWSFLGGTANSLTIENPNVTYNDFGSYDVLLTVIDVAGCQTEITKENYINIKAATAEYEIVNDRYIACLNENIQINNLTNYPCLWTNGVQTSSLDNFIVSFQTPGAYPISFTIDPGGVCEASENFVIYIESITASFTSNLETDFNCASSLTIDFTNTSEASASSFYYSFGNGISSYEENPSITFPAGVYQPALITTTANGCTATYMGTPFTIFNPQIGIYTNNDHCAPQTISLEFITFNFPQENVVSSSWDFGNGNFSNQGNFIEEATYSEGGDYNIHLEIEEINGCTASYDTVITFGTHYSPQISIIPENIICPLDTAIFTVIDDHSFCGYDCEVKYQWLLNETQNINATDIETEHVFRQDTGWVKIEIIVDHNSCIDTLFFNDSIYVAPPIIKNINAEILSCDNPYSYSFEVVATEADKFDWEIYYYNATNEKIIEFSETSTTNTTVLYDFSNQGQFWLRITAYNDTYLCNFVDSIVVNVSEIPIAEILPLANDTICNLTDIVFISTTEDVITGYHWDFGDGTSETTYVPNVTHQYLSGGAYTVVLTVSNGSNCSTSDNISFVIAGASIDISAVDNMGCKDLHTVFTNNSVSNDGMQSVLWTFHDGTTETGNIATHDYSGVGSYNVTLSIETEHGCNITRTFPNYVVITELNPNFLASTTATCVNVPITFTASEQSPDCSYHWIFGNGADTTTNIPQVSYIYNTGGNFDVRLEISNIYLCDTFLLKPAYIYIEDIEADFNLSNNFFACYPAELTITSNVTSNSSEAINYLWNFGNGASSVIESPSNVYNRPGDYEITLIATTAELQCRDTVKETVVVRGPYAEISLNKKEICVGDSIFFELINAENIDDFLWVLGGGNTSNNSSFYHCYDTYPTNGYYLISLSISSVIGNDTCMPPPIIDTIFIKNFTADFDIYDEAENPIISSCSPFNGKIKNLSQNENTIEWLFNNETFGNANQIEDIVVENHSQICDTFNVSIVITHALGCIDTLTKEFVVFPIPFINTSPDSIICENDSIQINTSYSDNYSYSWSPNYNISDTAIYNPWVFPIDSTKYFIRISNEFNCVNFDSINIGVQNRPQIDFDQNDIQIIIGESTSFSVSEILNTDNVKYTWFPDYEISCLSCLTPVLQPLKTTTYTLIIVDTNGCFEDKYDKTVIVKEIYTLDAPTAFTPLSDDGNNIIRAKGYGIKKFHSFRIFNRWGEEVFYTDEFDYENKQSKGWDGKVKGVVQNIDNYAFVIEAEMYNGEIKISKGSFMLIK